MIIAAMLLAAATPADQPVPVADNTAALIEAQTNICTLLHADLKGADKLATAIYNTLNHRVRLLRREIRGAADPKHVTRYEEYLELAVKMRTDEELRASKNGFSIYMRMAGEGCELPEHPFMLVHKEEAEF